MAHYLIYEMNGIWETIRVDKYYFDGILDKYKSKYKITTNDGDDKSIIFRINEHENQNMIGFIFFDNEEEKEAYKKRS